MHQLKTLIPIYLVLVMLSYLELIPLSITILGLTGFITAVLYLYQKKESKSIILSKKFLFQRHHPFPYRFNYYFLAVNN